MKPITWTIHTPAGVSHGQDADGNLSRWQWRRDVDPISDSSCATQDGSVITATTVPPECLHSKHQNEQIIRDLPPHTNTSSSLPVSALPPFRYEPITHPSAPLCPRFAIPPSFPSLPTLTDFTCLCSLSTVSFSPGYYVSPLSTLIPLLRSIHPVSLPASTSITSRSRQVSPRAALSIRPFRLSPMHASSRPSQHQTWIVSVDTEAHKLLKATCARYLRMPRQALFSYTLGTTRTEDVNSCLGFFFVVPLRWLNVNLKVCCNKWMNKCLFFSYFFSSNFSARINISLTQA